MTKIRDFIHKNPLSTAFVIIIVELLFQFNTHIRVTSDSLINGVIKELIFAAVALFLVYLIAGKSEVKFSTVGIGYTFKKSWWLLAIPITFGILITIVAIIAGRPLAGNIFVLLILTAIDAYSTGVCEEGLLRGVVFNSLLSKEGGTRRGIFTAMIVSSVFFGFIHVAPDFFASFPNIPLNEASQMIGKTIQTGMLGFFLSAIYMKNRNLWNIALIHGLNDFALMLPNNLFKITELGNYVDTSGGANSSGIFYYIMAVLSIPYIITAIRIVKNIELPQYGFYKEHWTPIKPTDNK